MKSAYLLDHLDDKTFDECLDDLYDSMRNAAKGVFDEWVEKGYINEAGREKLLSEWDDEHNELFGLLG